MRRFAILTVSALLLGACSQAGPTPPRTLDEVTWSNGGPTDELLTLRKDHSYKIVDPRQARGTHADSPQIGTYDVISAEYGIILLDSLTPLRLSAIPADARPYRFTPMSLTPSSAVPPGERDQYVHVVDQYFAPKAFLELKPNEASIKAWLP